MRDYYINEIEKIAKAVMDPSKMPVNGAIDVDWTPTADKASKAFKSGASKAKINKTPFTDLKTGKKFGRGLVGDALSGGKGAVKKSAPLAAGVAGLGAAGYGAKKLYEATHSKNKDVNEMLGSKKSKQNGVKAKREFFVSFNKMSKGEKSYNNFQQGSGNIISLRNKDLAHEYAKEKGNEADYLERRNKVLPKSKLKQNLAGASAIGSLVATPFTATKGARYAQKKKLESLRNVADAFAKNKNLKESVRKGIKGSLKGSAVSALATVGPLAAGLTASNALTRNANKKYLESLTPEELNHVKNESNKVHESFDKATLKRKRRGNFR